MDEKNGTHIKLDLILRKLEGIEDLLFGDNSESNPGMRLKVDRLEQSRKSHKAVLWVVFVTILTVAGTVAADIITRNI